MQITVIIPAFNREQQVCRAVNSVLQQGSMIAEVIVVDDGSTDGTAAMVAACGRTDPRVRLIRQDNAGVASARNRGLRAVRSEWVAFLDSDDEWQAGRLRTIQAIAQARPKVDLIHGDRVLLYPDGRVKQESIRSFAPALGEDKDFLLNNMVIKTSTVLVRMRVLRSLPVWFRQDLQTCEDYELFWRLASVARAVAYDASDPVWIHITPRSLTDGRRHLRLRDHMRARQSVLLWAQGVPEHAAVRRIMRNRLVDEVKGALGHAWTEGLGRLLAEGGWILRHVRQTVLWQEGLRRLRRRLVAGAQWIRIRSLRNTARVPRR